MSESKRNLQAAMSMREKNAVTAGQDCIVRAAVRLMPITRRARSAVYTKMAANFSKREWNARLWWPHPGCWQKRREGRD